MGKTREQHEKEIAKVIIQKKLLFIEWIFNHYPDLKKTQFYNLNLNESDIIKEALANNKCKGQEYMINKWIASENATLQIAAMRLVSDAEQRRMLNQQYIDHTSDEKPIQPTIKVMYEGDAKAIKRLYETGDSRKDG